MRTASQLLLVGGFILILFATCHETCEDDKDCSLNGECTGEGVHSLFKAKTTGKKCRCYSGWIGDHCQTLDLIPTARESGYRQIDDPKRGNFSSWGGGGWYDQGDDRYYMWATELADHCGMHTWTTNSMTVRASSTNATGLYQYEAVQIGIWSHESVVTRGPNGEYVAFFSYNADEGPSRAVCKLCSDGSTNPKCTKNSSFMYQRRSPPHSLGIENTDPSFMSWSEHPRGNWTEPVRVQPGPIEMDSNMAGVILSNGTFVGMWRDHYPGGHHSTPHLVTSSDWKVPSQYVFESADLIFGHEGKNPGGIEDMFLWLDRNGHFHALFHMMFDCPTCTGHAFSADGRKWKWTGIAAGATAQYLDNTSQTFGHCERPHLLFAKDGVTPIALTNGVKIQGLSNDDQSFTLLRRLKTD